MLRASGYHGGPSRLALTRASNAHDVAQNTAWTKMLSKVYKELMILGFISFVLLMIRQFADLPLTQLLMFELSHVWIFLVAVFFVVHAIIFMLLVRKVKRHWDATAHMEVPELLQKCVLHRGGCPPDTGVLPGARKAGSALR